jgi:hypothetical protein
MATGIQAEADSGTRQGLPGPDKGGGRDGHGHRPKAAGGT